MFIKVKLNENWVLFSIELLYDPPATADRQSRFLKCFNPIKFQLRHTPEY